MACGNRFLSVVVEPTLEGFNFFGSNLCGPFEPEEEANKAWDEVHGIAALRVDLNEDVGGEERLLNPLPAVAPALFHALGGTVDGVAGLMKAFGQFLFLPGLGVNHQPGELLGLPGWRRFWRRSVRHRSKSLSA